MRSFAGKIVAALLVVLMPMTARAADFTVFAAASLTDALSEVEKAYAAKTGRTASLSFAASSALARQIEGSGGGADMFISADNDWMDYLDKRGFIASATRKNLLSNNLVLIAPRDSSVALTIAPRFDILGALKGGRLAVADPDSVPAGRYARTALSALGVWNGVADRLAHAENVRVALAYVSRGEAPLGIVYTTDALSERNVRIVGSFPASSHPPIAYPAALTKDAKPAARDFLNYLATPEAFAVFRKYGFVVGQQR